MSLAWGGHRNGYIPASALALFVPGKYLHKSAVVSLSAMFADCKRATGVQLYIAAGQDLYRDYAGQQYWRNYWCSRGACNKAALPGTSNHGWGLAADISGYGNTSSASWKWLVANAGRYGFSNATGRAVGETWHWEYLGSLTTPAGGGAVLIPDTPETPKLKVNPNMYIRRATNGSMYLVTDFGTAPFGQPSHVNLFLRMFNTYPNTDDMLQAELDVINFYVITAQTELRNWIQTNVNTIRNDISFRDGILNSILANVKAVDTAPVVAAVVAAIKAQSVTVDPKLIATAVDSALADNFAKVKADADAESDRSLAAIKLIGTINTEPVVNAVIAAIKATGVAVDPQPIARAIEEILADDFVRLELKNQIK